MSRKIGPILVAHRGDPLHAPENTLASFRSAVSRGARAVEMDVRRCPDGTWIIVHNRFSRPPGLSARRAGGRREPVPTVAQALSFCRARRVSVFLDVKESSREKELLTMVRRSGWLRHTTFLVSSFASLRRWRRLLPAGHPLLWVTGTRMPLSERRVALARSVPVQGFVAYRAQITRASVRRAHAAGLRLLVWTARSAADLRRLVRLNVDGIMSEVWPPPRLT